MCVCVFVCVCVCVCVYVCARVCALVLKRTINHLSQLLPCPTYGFSKKLIEDTGVFSICVERTDAGVVSPLSAGLVTDYRVSMIS